MTSRFPTRLFAGSVALLFSSGAAQGQTDPRLASCDAAAFAEVIHAAARTERDAKAYWLDQSTIQWPGASAGRVVLHRSARASIRAAVGARVSGADQSIELHPTSTALSAALTERFKFLGGGPRFSLPTSARAHVHELLRDQLLIVREDAEGRVLEATGLQIPGAIDDLFAAATDAGDLGPSVSAERSALALWAPTAREVSVCLYNESGARAERAIAMHRDRSTGIWRASANGNLRGRAYLFIVEVFVPGVGIVRNRVSDPYAVALTADSRRAVLLDLDDPSTMPAGWKQARRPTALAEATDLTVYELHVRDFSVQDSTVRPDWRGKYLAFTESGGAGMHHLRLLAGAGMTDVHLLPAFDFASVPEQGCVTPSIPSAAADGESQQAAVSPVAERDCFNWGYDPFHYSVPEGSFATNAEDGATRIREFRQMVMALHDAGLRVGLDVVYNHTMASGQDARSVLDRIVPGYYHRLDAQGRVERSTCCDNTATEHAMMAKLMIESAARWVRYYGIDSFRFDLMGHQPRDAMERLQLAVDSAAGRHIPLVGEGWNFGEVANGARFVQASQLSLQGSGIATFSDRARDALRGGGCCDGGEGLVANQGLLNGLHYAPNAMNTGRDRRAELLKASDLARVGLAGTLRDYQMIGSDGTRRPLSAFDYAGGPAGYAAEPSEVVNYVENHDNLTLFDLNALRLPRDVSREERARAQLLGVAFTTFSQGIAYFHAGVEIMRSKSLDRNSFNSGDWFNRLDWSYRDNGFGAGVPRAEDNRNEWPFMKPVLADARIKPAPSDIRWMRDASLDLLRIRSSSTLFRMRSTADVQRRLRFVNVGPQQNPLVIGALLDGNGYPGAVFSEVLYLINLSGEAQELVLPEAAGREWTLHPVHRASAAADRRAQDARFEAVTGRVRVPARTAVVFVRSESAEPAAKAVFILLDGIPADVIERAHTPSLDEIAAAGAYARASVGGELGGPSETPTVSAPGYMSLLTATWANKHNVQGNNNQSPNYSFWNIFRIVESVDARRNTALFSTWLDNRTVLIGEGRPEAGGIKLDHSVDGFEYDTLAFPHDRASRYILAIDERVSNEAAAYIAEKGPDLSWVYLQHSDDAGHAHGDGDAFLAAVQHADALVGRIWEAVKRRQAMGEDWMIVVTTDHGRDAATGKGHGRQSQRERTTWIATNTPDVDARFSAGRATIVDIAPSILQHLRIAVPDSVARQMDGVSFLKR